MPERTRSPLARAADRALRSGAIGSAACLATLLAFAAASGVWRAWLVELDPSIGHADTAAYAEIGRSLAEGRGFHVQYVNSFFIPYDVPIDRPDDNWPPFMGMVIAPFFASFGVSAYVAKLPAIWIGVLALPLATFWLGRAASGRSAVGLLAALGMLANPDVFEVSLTTFGDVALAALIAAFGAAMLEARSRPGFYVVAGLFAALAYYAKGSELLLVGLYPAVALLTAGPRVLRDRRFALGAAALLLGLLPWWISNLVHYGSPLHSTQNYTSAFIGLESWEMRQYRVHWGRDLPRTRDRWTQHPERYGAVVRANRETYARWALLGADAQRPEWRRLGPLGAFAHRILRGEALPPGEPGPADAGRWLLSAPNLVGGAAAGIALVALPAILARRRRRGSRGVADDWPRDVGAAAALGLVMLVHAAFVVYLWTVYPRFTFLCLPILAVLGWWCVAACLRPLARRLPDRARPVGTLVLCAGVATVGAASWPAITRWQQREADVRRVETPKRDYYDRLGEYVAAALPADAVLMSRNPVELRFYSPSTVRTVALPWARPPQLLGVARHYGVTHYVEDRFRPGMDRYLRGRHPGLKPLRGAPGLVYEIDWSAFRPGEITEPGGGAAP